MHRTFLLLIKRRKMKISSILSYNLIALSAFFALIHPSLQAKHGHKTHHKSSMQETTSYGHIEACKRCAQICRECADICQNYTGDRNILVQKCQECIDACDECIQKCKEHVKVCKDKKCKNTCNKCI